MYAHLNYTILECDSLKVQTIEVKQQQKKIANFPAANDTIFVHRINYLKYFCVFNFEQSSINKKKNTERKTRSQSPFIIHTKFRDRDR